MDVQHVLPTIAMLLISLRALIHPGLTRLERRFLPKWWPSSIDEDQQNFAYRCFGVVMTPLSVFWLWQLLTGRP